MKFKKFDKVIIKDTGQKCYVDAVVMNSYLVRISDGYEWIDEWNLDYDNEKIEQNKNLIKQSDIVKRMLGDI